MITVNYEQLLHDAQNQLVVEITKYIHTIQSVDPTLRALVGATIMSSILIVPTLYELRKMRKNPNYLNEDK
jgi:hypothetical protein